MLPRVTSPSTRFSAAEFERMADSGVFGDKRVELINGRIYRTPPQNDLHMSTVAKVARTLYRLVSDDEKLLCMGTLRVDRNTTVDPEFTWLETPISTPHRDWPPPLLVIEVSDTSYRIDSGIKLRKYAKVGIRDYWIVNVQAQRVEVYRSPTYTGKLSTARYAETTIYSKGQSIALLGRPELVVAVNDLLL